MATINLQTLFSDDDINDTDITKVKILDAALEETAAQGHRGLTLEGVARRGGLNRATIYRQFGGKEQLMNALALREAKKLVVVLKSVTEDLSTPEDVLVEGFVSALRFARQHPVISRLLRFEPGSIVDFANAENATMLKLGATVMASTISWAQSLGFAKHFDANDAGDVLARLFSSYVVFPNGHNQLDTDEKSKAFAQRVLIPILNGPK